MRTSYRRGYMTGPCAYRGPPDADDVSFPRTIGQSGLLQAAGRVHSSLSSLGGLVAPRHRAHMHECECADRIGRRPEAAGVGRASAGLQAAAAAASPPQLTRGYGAAARAAGAEPLPRP